MACRFVEDNQVSHTLVDEDRAYRLTCTTTARIGVRLIGKILILRGAFTPLRSARQSTYRLGCVVSPVHESHLAYKHSFQGVYDLAVEGYETSLVIRVTVWDELQLVLTLTLTSAGLTHFLGHCRSFTSELSWFCTVT